MQTPSNPTDTANHIGRRTVLILRGGLRDDSATRTAARCMGAQIQAHGATPVDIPVNTPGFPLRTAQHDDKAKLPPSVRSYLDVAQAAHAAIWVFPVYHGSMPGAFKNALDFADDRTFARKPLGIVCMAGGNFGGQVAWTQAAYIAQVLHAYVSPVQVVVRDTWRWHDGSALVAGSPDPAVTDRFASLVDDVLNARTVTNGT